MQMSDTRTGVLNPGGWASTRYSKVFFIPGVCTHTRYERAATVVLNPGGWASTRYSKVFFTPGVGVPSNHELVNSCYSPPRLGR